MKTSTSHSGFTLLELLIAAYILVIGISSTLLLNVNAMASAEFAWDLTTATTHAEQILEDMQVRDSLADIVNTDWGRWAQEQHLTTLPREQIIVHFGKPDADPLDIKVTVGWQRKSKKDSISISTRLTK